METLTPLLIWASILLWALSFIPYILEIYGRSILLESIQPRTPSKATWLIFFLMDIVVAYGMYRKDTLNAQIVTAIAGALLVFIISLFRGKPGWTKVDAGCIALTAIGIFLGLWHWEAWWSIVIGSIAMVIGGIPTIRQVWSDPESESLLAWSMGLASCVCILPTIQPLSLEAFSQPIAFFIVESAIVGAIVLQQSRPKKARP